MRRRRLKKLLKRLQELQGQTLTRDQLLLKLGAARKEAGRPWGLVDIRLPNPDQAVTPETFRFTLNRHKLRTARRREGSYLLRSNLKGDNNVIPALRRISSWPSWPIACRSRSSTGCAAWRPD